MDSRLREVIRKRACRICEYCQVPEEYDRLPFQPNHIIAKSTMVLRNSRTLRGRATTINLERRVAFRGELIEEGMFSTAE